MKVPAPLLKLVGKFHVPEKLEPIKKVLSSKRDRFVVRFLLIIMSATSFTLVGGTVYFVKKLKAERLAEMAENEGHGEDDHGAEHAADSHEGGDGHGGPSTTEKLMGIVNRIPKSITKRQDGIMEKGHDLVDPEPVRELASILLKDVDTDVGYRFVNIPPVSASTKAIDGQEGMMITEIAVQVEGLASQKEVEARKIEIQQMIGAIISGKPKTELRTVEGRIALKKQLQKEMNFKLQEGRVLDVLYLTFYIR